jgi:hypothetical protein
MGDIATDDIKTPSSKVLWKYLNLHKLLDFLISSELHFTRLDAFNDPIEGVKTSLLRDRADLKDWATSVDDPSWNPNLGIEHRQPMVNRKLQHDLYYAKEVEMSQKCQFVSCWFGDENEEGRESMAMWDIYSGPDSVVLKIDTNSLITEMQNTAQSYITLHEDSICILGDSVKYLKLNPFDKNLPLQTGDYAGMKKDVTFSHEHEYRFLISAGYEWAVAKNQRIFRYKIDLAKLPFTVVCHPLMEDWKVKNIERLVEKFGYNFKVQRSSVELRR